MVASQHELASKIGVEILRRAETLSMPRSLSGLRSRLSIRKRATSAAADLCSFGDRTDRHLRSTTGKWPRPPHSRNIFVDQNGNLIKGEGSSTVGYRASGVPGTLAGFDMAFKKYGSGKLKWRDLVEPARQLAQNGYILTDRLAKLFIEYKETLAKYPDSNRIFLNNGRLL